MKATGHVPSDRQKPLATITLVSYLTSSNSLNAMDIPLVPMNEILHLRIWSISNLCKIKKGICYVQTKLYNPYKGAVGVCLTSKISHQRQ